MNGGTFTPGVEKERAGIYFRFVSAANDRLSVGERGTVALPLKMAWGPPKTFVEIRDEDDILKKLGLEISDPSVLLLREAMKRSQTVLVYRVTEGQKAEAVLSEGGDGEGGGGQLKAIAKYGGSKGNEIHIRVAENVLDSSLTDVTTFMSNQAVHRQTVTAASELQSNDWVDFEGDGHLQETAGTRLEGGSDSEPTNLDYTDFFAAAETEYFDVIALPVDEEDQLKTTFVSFVKRVRDDQGIKIVGVLPNYAGDFEGILNVTNGVELENGQKLSPADAVAWVAGASAGATMHQSLTFVEYEGAVDAVPRFDNDEIIERLGKGEFMFTFDPREKSVSVEKDINSFTSFRTEKNEKFQKNKIIRILDGINNDLRREIKQLIKDRKDNGSDIPVNEDGKQTIRTLITVYMNILQDGNAIENFDSQEDIVINANALRDGFVIDLGVQPVDAAEKFYIGVEVR